jgi:hypothetical protein
VLDWKQIAREKLGAMSLEPGRQEEIVEEIAQQLESAYEEERARGTSQAEAVRRSIDQFPDWERLRSEMFKSISGAELPIWVQNGALAPRKPLVWIALALALCFLAVPSFRKAMNLLPLWRGVEARDSRVFSEQALRKMERSGDQQKYARTLAYAALHSPDDLRAAAAEKAIALDPNLTWISAKVSHATYLVPGYDPKPWIARLQAWDPQNAFGYLLEADASIHADWETRWGHFLAFNGDLRRALAAEPRWRSPMEKAFASPRLDSYQDRQFVLDRTVLLEQGLDRPDKLTIAASSFQLPDLFMVKTYADYLRLDVGDAAEGAGDTEKALMAYRNVALFGQKLRLGWTTVEHLFSAQLREDAYLKMIPLLRRSGRNPELAMAESSLALAQAEDPKSNPFERNSQTPALRSGQITALSLAFLILFAIAATLWLASVCFLRVRPVGHRVANWVAARLAWGPALLPVTCLAVTASFYPYAGSIAQYSPDDIPTFRSFLFGFSFQFDPIFDIWVEHMFYPLLACAGILLLGAAYLRWNSRRKHASES